MVKASKTLCITSKQWRYVTSVCKNDFELLVAHQEWQVLDRLAGKVGLYTESVEPTEGQQDFLDLYDYTSDYLAEHGQLPPAVLALVRGKDAL